jgi:Uncharacterized protein conserved in bacteria (DUF2188)
MTKNDRYVVRHPDGWAVKGAGQKASAVYDTQKEAERSAKNIVSNLGGGEVRIQDRQAKWRDSDTVSPGNESPYKDKKY